MISEFLCMQNDHLGQADAIRPRKSMFFQIIKW